MSWWTKCHMQENPTGVVGGGERHKGETHKSLNKRKSKESLDNIPRKRVLIMFRNSSEQPCKCLNGVLMFAESHPGKVIGHVALGPLNETLSGCSWECFPRFGFFCYPNGCVRRRVKGHIQTHWIHKRQVDAFTGCSTHA